MQHVDMPRLPKHFVERSSWATAGYLGYGLMLTLVPGLTALAIWSSTLVTVLKLPVILFLSILSAYGYFMLGASGHEGFHFNLHRNRLVSALIGTVSSAVVPGFCAVGFFVNHWSHHRYTNTSADPDVMLLQRFKSFWSRAVCARLAANRRYLVLAIAILRGQPLDGYARTPLPQRQLLLLARVTLLAQAFWLTLYGTLIVYAPLAACFVLGLPFLILIVISGLNPFLEHAGTEIAPWRNARTRSSPVLTLLMAGTNYHLEHHLYPAVPCWRLPRLHRWLREQGALAPQQTILEPSFLQSFRWAASNVPYTTLAS